MAYTTIDKPSDYFNTKLYTGTGSSNSISGISFAPDWVWIKNRGLSGHHMLFDKVRGATKALYSNLTDAETTVSGHLTSFDSDGFTLGDNSGKGSTNGNTETYVAWNWKANGSGSANTDGSISSTVSASATSGFSIVSYSGSTNSTFTVGHGLSAVPKIFILKKRSSSGTNWVMYNANLGNDKRIQLNNTDASASTSGYGNTDPTSSVFTVANGSTTGADGQTYIAYCFAEKKGYSKFGSYTGNGNADGTFIYTGFKPAFVIAKVTSRAGFTWVMYDNKRDTFNTVGQLLQPDVADAELDNSNIIDFLSNGIKMRNNSLGTNGSGDTYIYMCFAENPFVTSTGVPATAR